MCMKYWFSLVNRLVKLAQEKVWLGELTIAVDLGGKPQTKQEKLVSVAEQMGLCVTGLNT